MIIIYLLLLSILIILNMKLTPSKKYDTFCLYLHFLQRILHSIYNRRFNFAGSSFYLAYPRLHNFLLFVYAK